MTKTRYIHGIILSYDNVWYMYVVSMSQTLWTSLTWSRYELSQYIPVIRQVYIVIIRNVTRSKLVHKVWDMVTTYIYHTLSYDMIFPFIYQTYTRHIPYEKGIYLVYA